jgi:hypothetical protein
MRNKLFFLLLLCFFVSFVAGEETPPAQTGPKLPMEFSGRIVDTRDQLSRKTTTYFTMKIEKLTPVEDIQTYAAILAKDGPDKLVDKIHNLDNGWVRVGSRLSYHLSITRVLEKDGKKMVRAVTDRPIAMAEVMKGTRSEDYPFGIIELLLDEQGKGQGRLTAAAKMQFKDATLEVESFGIEPFAIMNVVLK